MMQTDKEYAEALFMLALEEQKTDEYLDYLKVVRSLLEENADYIEFLASPAIPLKERKQAIEQAFGNNMSEYIVSFLKLLCQNGRIRILKDSIDEYSKLVLSVSNRAVVNIFSAIPLSDEQKKALCEKLEKSTGKSVEPMYIVDESLIGGIKIEIDGKTYDGSIKHRLYDIKDVIIG